MYLSLEAYAAGWVSGIANVLVGHPFDTGKVRRQAGLKSKYRFSNLAELLHRVRFVYRGVTGPVLTVGALLSINFGTWRSCKDALEATERGRSYGYGVDFISGVFSGGFCAQIVFPLQCIKVRAQTIPEPKLTFRESFRDFCKTSSYRSTIARGYVPHLLQESVGRGLYMVTYQILTDKGHNKMLSGGCAGVMGWVVTYPFDLARSRMLFEYYATPESTRMPPPRLGRYLYNILQTEGLQGLYQGCSYCIVRAIPVAMITLPVYDLTFRYLSNTEK